MSAIYTDAADIPPALPHPTGAATVINSNSVDSNFTFTSNLFDSAFASTTFSSASASWSSVSSSFSSAPASTSRLESRDSELPSASDSRLESRDSQLPPSPRDFSLEAHQAEYRAHAYLANESIVTTKLAADKFLQNLFKTQTEPDKDILRAASVASRARLQNPFAYNNSRSSGSSGSSSDSSSYYSGSSGSSGSSGASGSSSPRSSSSAPNSSSNPSAPKTSPAPAAPVEAIEPSPADIDQPLTEADFTDCIKLEDAISNTASRGTAILGGLPLDSTTTATPDAKKPPKMAVPRIDAAQSNPITPESIEAAPTPEPASDLAIWKFGHSAISPCETISPPAPPCLNLATWPFHHFTTSSPNASWPLGP